jgi:hypothetical protein
MACGVDPGTSILEGSDVQEIRATDIGGAVGGGGGKKAREGEDVFGDIAGCGGSSGAIAADGNGYCLSPHPRPCLHCGHHWQGTRWQGNYCPSLNFLVLVLP